MIAAGGNVFPFENRFNMYPIVVDMPRPSRTRPMLKVMAKLHRAGIIKWEIARRLQIGRTSVRRMLRARL